MIELNVIGMSCSHCAGAVAQAIKGVDPKASVRVDVEGSKVRIDSGAPVEALARAVTDAGYPAAPAGTPAAR